MKKFFSLIAAVLFAGSMMAESLLSIDFTQGQGEWTINDVNLGGLEYVWAQSSQYGMKATGYVGGNHETESWLVSPVVDLSAASEATLNFSHARRYGDLSQLAVLAKAGEGEWTALTVSAWPDGSNWTFINASASLNAFAGQAAVQVAFKYTSTASGGATWEIKTVEITNDGSVTPPAEALDTINVAKALEIGQKLASGAKTEVQYVIEGYVSDIVEVYASATDYETFWMVDTKGSRAKTNADGAFEVYRGAPVQKMTAGMDGHVFVTAKIQNYNGTTIETSGKTSINIVEQGTVEEVESIDVAKALEIGRALANGGVSEKRYEITGYVSNVYTFFNPDFGNETVWLSDDPTSTASSLADNAFEIYRGKPNTKAEVGLGAKVKITCKIKNYNGTTIENDGSNVPFEVIEASTFVPDTVNIEEAVAITSALAEGAKAPKYSVVKGFIQSVVTPYDASKNNATYKLADFAGEAEGAVQAYKATILKADAEKVAANNYVLVTGYLMKKNAGAQIAEGSLTTFAEAPKADTIRVNVAEAVAAGLALPVGEKSDKIYAVTGYVNFVQEDFAAGIESFFMADDAAESESFNFYAINATVAEAAAVGQRIELVGLLQNADGETITIENGKARLLWPEGIENVVLTEKVQKVMVDGMIYIVRDGKMFDIRGTQVR